MRYEGLLVIDVGAGHVAGSRFAAAADGRLRLLDFALEPQDAESSYDARWPMELAPALGRLAARLPPAGAASIAVPGHLTLTRFITTPAVAREQHGRIAALEAAENLPYPLEEMIWDHRIVADDGANLELVVAAAKAEAMNALCGAAVNAGFRPESATASGFALGRAFRYNYPEVSDPVLVVDVGARSTHVLLRDGEQFYFRTVPLGGNVVTLAAAAELRIDFARAEALCRSVRPVTAEAANEQPEHAAVHRAATMFGRRLAIEILRTTVSRRRQSGGAAPVAIYLAGGGALIAGMPDAIAARMKLPVERYEPLRNVDVADGIRAAGAGVLDRFPATLVGLATQLTGSAPMPGLLPPALAAQAGFRKRQPHLLGTAVLAMTLLLPPIGYFHRLTSDTLAQVSALEARLVPVRELRSRIDGNLRQLDEARSEIAALRGAYEARGGWIRLLADLQERLVAVENVWLDQFELVRETPPGPRAGATDANPGNASPGQPPWRVAAPRLALSGRLLDVDHPQSKVSPQSFERVKQLLQTFRHSPFVAAIEEERFDNTRNGLLRFDVTLVLDPENPL